MADQAAQRRKTHQMMDGLPGDRDVIFVQRRSQFGSVQGAFSPQDCGYSFERCFADGFCQAELLIAPARRADDAFATQ